MFSQLLTTKKWITARSSTAVQFESGAAVLKGDL
jgi:hypothetical protein